jgi:hypothetical protein
MIILAAALTRPAYADGNGVVTGQLPPAPQTRILGPVTIGGPWLEFGFGATGSFATGCAPADPAGLSCVPSSGGNSAFLDAPRSTLTVPPTWAQLTVTDAFAAGDQFEVYESNTPIGTTSSVPVSGASCSDPDICSTAPEFSHGVFTLAPGAHSLTIAAVAQPRWRRCGLLSHRRLQLCRNARYRELSWR